LASNSHAISFYQRLGFQQTERIPMRKVTNSDSELLVPFDNKTTEDPDDFFTVMVFSRKPIVVPEQPILTAGPSISEREVFYSWDAARNGWNRNWNFYIRKFESQFSEFLGVSHSISTSSCTGALHIAMSALGIGPGDEVIVPEITWVATANAVSLVGAIPVFCDVESDTWCLDPFKLEDLITARTKAVVPVHLYGHPAKMDEIVKVARNHNLFVVEDAAPAIGAEWKGERVGSFGDFACFSLQGAKLLVAGEGGVLVTNQTDLYEKAKKIWDQGRDPNKTFWIDSPGLKYKMSNIQAAIALGQIERCDQQIIMKRRIAEWYRHGLEQCPFISMFSEHVNAKSIYWMSSCLVHEDSPISRDLLCDELRKRKIDTRPIFPAISQYPIWPTLKNPKPIAQSIGRRGINLPSGVCLTREEVNYVTTEVKKIMSQS
jgi:perosamine synthetase